MRIHGQRDFDAAFFAELRENTSFVVAEVEEPVDVDGGVFKELGALNAAEHVKQAAVLVEAVAPEESGVGGVDQVEVVDFVEQGGIVGDSRVGQERVEHAGVFARAFQFAEGGVELGNVAYTIDATDKLQTYDFGASKWNALVFNYVPAQIVGDARKRSRPRSHVFIARPTASLFVTGSFSITNRRVAVRILSPGRLRVP